LSPGELPGTPWKTPFVASATVLLASLLLLALARSVGRALRAREPELPKRAFAVISGALLLTVLAQLAAHLAIGLRFPEDRMSLYSVPLVTLALAGLFSSRRLGALVGLAVLLAYVSELDTSGTRTWRYDAGTKRVLLALKGLAPAGHAPLKLGGTWLSSPSVNVYKYIKGYDWLAPYPNEMGGDPGRYEYFLYHPEDYPNLDPRIEAVIDRDPTSGVLLAKIRPSG